MNGGATRFYIGKGNLIPDAAMNMENCWTDSMTRYLSRMLRSGRIWHHCKGKKNDLQMGLTNPTETVLTRMEFVKELQRLIEKTL